ncbi:MAG: cadmium-translocating P-type ATPase [Clostridia bacterium]|nr:cadmium-translocating P-type ATPase [Clostridia bacterium]
MSDLLKRAQDALKNSTEELKKKEEEEIAAESSADVEWEYEDGAILYDHYNDEEMDSEQVTLESINDELSEVVDSWEFEDEEVEEITEVEKTEETEEVEEIEELEEPVLDTSKFENVEKKVSFKDKLANVSPTKIKKKPTFEEVPEEEDVDGGKVKVFNFNGHHHDHGHKFTVNEHETGEEGSIIERIKRLGIGLAIFIVGFILFKAIKKTIWVGLPFFIIAYIFLGYDVILRAVGRVLHRELFDENFLMSIASLAAFITGHYPEAVIVMLLYQIGEFLEDLALGKSKKSIAKLMDIRPEIAHVNRGRIIKVHPSEVQVGDVIVVRAGERVPLDGVIENGRGFVDTSALTGEPVPRKVAEGDEVLAGFIDKDAYLNIKVTKRYEESTVSKILELVENASDKKAPAEQFITKFSRYYTPAVLALALIIAVVPSLISKAWTVWLYRACVLLVIACPCALVISVPLAFFAGLGLASRNGVLVKGSNYLEALNNIDTVVFDKTGTLTKGTFAVTQASAANDFKNSQLMTLVAYAECLSNHPIAKSIMDLYYSKGGKPINKDKISDYKEIPGHGVSVVVGNHLVLAGNAKLMRAANISFTENTSTMGSKVYVAADGQFAGYFVVSDEIKEDAREGIGDLKLAGIEHTVMLTGDNADAASAVAKTVGIEKYYAELLPNDKVEKLEEVMRGAEGIGLVAFMGDGLNDAPVLARADIGVAMGGIGSDAALEAADVVIMDDHPSKLVDAINIARDTKMIVKENIIGSLSVKALIILLGIFGVANMWFAVFGDVGVLLLAIFNSMRLMKK